MEKVVHSRPVSEEDEALSCSKKLKFEDSPAPEDTENYTLFTDSEYKLPFYLSEFALGEFNSKKKAKFEKVNVVKTMKSLDVKGTTYLITFEASSRGNKSNNGRTFETNIFMSPFEPSTEIYIKFVRIKPFELDYSEEEDSEEEDSESDGENTEEKNSDFSGIHSAEIKLAESDKKDTKNMKDSAEKNAESNVNKSAEEKVAVKKSLNKKSSLKTRAGRRSEMISCCTPSTYYDPPACTLSRANLNRLVCLSQLAICVYNMKEDTYYDNVHVFKATASGCGRSAFNIIFEASLSDGNDVIFQTEISTSLPFPYHKVDIQLVRIKPSINSHFITD